MKVSQQIREHGAKERKDCVITAGLACSNVLPLEQLLFLPPAQSQFLTGHLGTGLGSRGILLFRAPLVKFPALEELLLRAFAQLL